MHVSFQYYCMRQIRGRWRKQMKRDWQRSRCVATEDCFVSDGRTSIPTNPSEDNSVVNTPSWTVRHRKLELFGHICRMPDNRMLKRVLFRAVEGRNYQGWPRKCWVDDKLKWCDMTLQQASHHAQDRTTWRNLIAGPYGSWTTGKEEEEEEVIWFWAPKIIKEHKFAGGRPTRLQKLLLNYMQFQSFQTKQGLIFIGSTYMRVYMVKIPIFCFCL